MRLPQWDRGLASFERTNAASVKAELDDEARVKRLAGTDFVSGKYAENKHRFNSVQRVSYRIEYKLLQGVRTFSFQ